MPHLSGEASWRRYRRRTATLETPLGARVLPASNYPNHPRCVLVYLFQWFQALDGPWNTVLVFVDGLEAYCLGS